MFKKTILVAALGAISAGAYAADVELYGVVDTGLKYTHEKWVFYEVGEPGTP